MNKRAPAIIIAGFFTIFTAYAVRYCYGMLLPEMFPALSISKTQAGVIYSSYFIAYTIFSPLLGLLADRYSIRAILTLFVAILGTGAYLMSQSSSVLNASLFFALAGIGHSACWVPVVTLIQRWVSDKRRGTALAFADLGNSIGIIIWSLIIPLIVRAYSWRAGWISLGILAFMVAGMNLLLVKDHPKDRHSSQHPTFDKMISENIGITYLRLLSDQKFWLIGLSYLLLGFSVLIPYTFLSTYAAKELAIPYDASTGLIGMIAVASILGKLILGYLSDTIGRVKIMMVCAALLAAGNLGMAYSQRLLTLSLSSALFGFGYGAVWSVYAASAVDYFSRKSSGSVIGLWTMYLGVGSILSPILSGWAIDATGTYASAFTLALAGAFIAILLLWPVDRNF